MLLCGSSAVMKVRNSDVAHSAASPPKVDMYPLVLPIISELLNTYGFRNRMIIHMNFCRWCTSTNRQSRAVQTYQPTEGVMYRHTLVEWDRLPDVPSA